MYMYKYVHVRAHACVCMCMYDPPPFPRAPTVSHSSIKCPQFHKFERDPAETDAEHMDRCCKDLFKYYRKAYKDVLDGHHH